MAYTWRAQLDHEGLQVISDADVREVVASPHPLSGNSTIGSSWVSPIYETPSSRQASSPHPTHSFISRYTTEKIFYDPAVDRPHTSQSSLPAGRTGKDVDHRGRLICGIRRRTFWITMGLANFVLLLALGLGVGLAFGLMNDTPAASSPTSSPKPTQNVTSTASATPTTWGIPLPIATATAVTNTSGILEEGTRAGCPLNDRTVYLAYSTNIRFLLMCGRDYPADVEGNLSLFTDDRKDGTHSSIGIGECMELCAIRGDCEGVGFYYNMCLFKRRARTPKKKEGSYPFALRIVD